MSGHLVDLVVPTVGRPSLARLLEALANAAGPPPGRVLLVDDRRRRDRPLLPGPPPGRLAGRTVVIAGRAAGPAAARNDGWRRATARWTAFLDDDVLPDPDWPARLEADLRDLGPEVAGSQGRLRVPLPGHRRPTDWERNVAALEGARWATADMAYRRDVLAEVGGFDERFRRAYREDADLALRVIRAGYRIEWGRRTVAHPVGPADALVSVRLQAGNGDDVLMRALHGRGWRRAIGETGPRRRPRHLAATAAGVVGLGALAAGRRRLAALGGLGWLTGTAELAWARIAPGPRSAREVATMLLTSLLIPPAATWHWLRGYARLPGLLAAAIHVGGARSPRPTGAPPWGSPDPSSSPPRSRSFPGAVLLDRDGTLVEDVPYNGDPLRVVPRPGARRALERLRAAGVPTAVVSNQSGLARGLLRHDQVAAVNRRVEELLGPLGPWLVCPHGPDDGCGCRKPAPGLVHAAARALGVDPGDCVLVGDIGADVEAARAAGAHAVLVPTRATRAEEIAAAPLVAADLEAAVALILGAGAEGPTPEGSGEPRGGASVGRAPADREAAG
jgi:histidinol-phosphate phosphatase family protein